MRGENGDQRFFKKEGRTFPWFHDERGPDGKYFPQDEKNFRDGIGRTCVMNEHEVEIHEEGKVRDGERKQGREEQPFSSIVEPEVEQADGQVENTKFVGNFGATT